MDEKHVLSYKLKVFDYFVIVILYYLGLLVQIKEISVVGRLSVLGRKNSVCPFVKLSDVLSVGCYVGKPGGQSAGSLVL